MKKKKNKTYIGKSGDIGSRLSNYYNYKLISLAHQKMLIYKALV